MGAEQPEVRLGLDDVRIRERLLGVQDPTQLRHLALKTMEPLPGLLKIEGAQFCVVSRHVPLL
jgi:hypothetical protein